MKRSCLSAALALLAITSIANAQITTGTILGTVADSSGAVVPGVTLTVRQLETNLERRAETDHLGNYTISNLPPGHYKLTATAPAFKTHINPDLDLQVQQTARVDIKMSVGDVAEQVSVTDVAPILNTDDAARGSVINNKMIVELPLNGRNFNQLATLVPNVQPGVTGGPLQNLLGNGIAVWANGQRDTNNEWNLDGATMNIGFYNWGAFVPSVDAIQEFKVQTGMYSAEFGFQAGANINIMVKSGTNSLHGTLYEFLRNEKMDATNYFASQRETLKQNQFGGTVGGPVYLPKLYDGRNRTFFFVSYEASRQRTQAFTQTIVPTAAWRRGDVTRNSAGAILSLNVKDPTTGQPFPNGTIPDDRISPVAKNLLAYWPTENRPGVLYNFALMAPVVRDLDDFITKFDHRINDRATFYVRYARDTRFRPDPEYIPTFFRTTRLQAHNAVVSYTHVITPRTLNDFKIGFNRSNITQTDTRDNTDFNIQQELGIPGITASGKTAGFPAISIQGVAALGDNTSDPLYQPDETWQFTDNLTMFRGRHNLKAGADIRAVRSDRYQGVNVRGAITFVHSNPAGSGFAFADTLLGLPQYTAIGLSAAEIRMRNHRIAGYFLDDYKVNSRLTLNIGLRYELNTVISDTRGTVGNFDFATMTPISLASGQGFYQPSHNQWAPRVALAYRPFRDNKTVIRAGYGIFYNSNLGLALTRLAQNPPYATQAEFYSSLSSPITFANPFPSVNGSKVLYPSYSGTVNDYRAGYAQSRSFDIQRQITNSLMLEIGYFGSSGLGLDRLALPNTAPPGPGAVQARRPYPQYGNINQIRSDAKSLYNGLTIKVEHRLSKNLTGLSSYTFSRSIDQSFSSISSQPNDAAAPQNSRNLAAERGLAASHRKNRWIWSAVYILPFGQGQRYLANNRVASALAGGWQVSVVGTFQSGEVFGLVSPGDLANQGGGVTRPNRVCDGNLPSDQRSLRRWFDTSCIVNPPAYTFGNASRAFLIGPAVFNVDSGVSRQFRIAEAVRLHFRAEAFNMANHPNFGTPGTTIGTDTFGVINTAREPRVMQMALKLTF